MNMEEGCSSCLITCILPLILSTVELVIYDTFIMRHPIIRRYEIKPASLPDPNGRRRCAPPPERDSILSFSHMLPPKSTHVGGWRPPMGQHPPMGNPGSTTVHRIHRVKDITDIVNDVCTDCCYVMGYNYVHTVGYCLYRTLLLCLCYCMSCTNQSSSSHRCLYRHQL